MEITKEYMEELFRKLYKERHPLYMHRPIPCAFDAEISTLVNAFMQANPGERKKIVSYMKEDYSSWLFVFSNRMAALAVRKMSRSHILEGLVALVLEDYRYDVRDNIVCLAPLYHSAVKIGVDTVALFNEAASYFDNEAAET